jgi:glycosyltransferase involved in cell wall biosynthesis
MSISAAFSLLASLMASPVLAKLVRIDWQGGLSATFTSMPLTERVVWCVDVALGVGAWLVFAYLLTVSRERMLKLRQSRAVLPAQPPLISILVPAKDEGDHIRTCIERVRLQDYPAFEVIAINDRSTDETGRVLDELSSTTSSREAPSSAPRPGGEGVAGGVPSGETQSPAQSDVASNTPLAAPTLPSPPRGEGHELNAPRALRVVHIDHLPEGWLGKCHALYNGTREARGEWLFFVDSDVKLQPDALSKMAALAIERNYDAMSIMTHLETQYFIERLMIPLLAGTWAALFAADQTNEDSQPDRAVANGQVFLIRASAYRAVDGHQAVKDRIVEDVELMRLLKKRGFKTRFFAGRHLASTRMHTHLRQMFQGWARIYAGTSRGSIWPMVRAIGFFLLCVATIIPATIWAVTTHSGWWGTAAIAHYVAMTVFCAFLWIFSGNNPAYALLLPLSVPIELAILLFSIRRAISGKVHWRGSEVSIRETVARNDQ